MAEMTTVKVSSQVRDRINANVKRRGNRTVDSYLRELLDRDEWQERLRGAAEDMRFAGDDEEYQAEINAWDALNADLHSGRDHR